MTLKHLKDKELPLSFYRMVLIAAAAVWGLGFIIGKGAINEIGATWFTALRFIGSGLILLIFLLPHIMKHFNAKLLRAGCIMGLFSFLGFWTQFMGLGLTTPSKNAFLSACYCLTVPFIWWVVAKIKPQRKALIAAVICVIGIGLVSLEGTLAISLGDGMSILSSFTYGLEIVVISLVMKDNDLLTVTTVQQLTSGILATILALATSSTPTLQQMADPTVCGAIIYVVLLSATFGSIAQNLAQSRLTPAEAGLICSTECVFCATFSALFFGEAFTTQMLIGFVLIFAAIVLAQYEPKAKRKD